MATGFYSPKAINQAVIGHGTDDDEDIRCHVTDQVPHDGGVEAAARETLRATA